MPTEPNPTDAKIAVELRLPPALLPGYASLREAYGLTADQFTQQCVEFALFLSATQLRERRMACLPDALWGQVADIKVITHRINQAAAAAVAAVHANQVVLARVEGMISDLEEDKV
jgi:hypothetical protein